MKKKAQIDSLIPIVATLIVVGLLVGAGVVILQEFLEQDSFQLSKTIDNETVTASQYLAGHALDGASYKGSDNFVITSVVNASNGEAVSSTLYSVEIHSGTFSNSSANSNYTTYDWNVTYSFNYVTDTYQGINDTIDSVNTIPELLGLIILIVVIGIILTIIFRVIPSGRVAGA